jgi:hypothetical protein
MSGFLGGCTSACHVFKFYYSGIHFWDKVTAFQVKDLKDLGRRFLYTFDINKTIAVSILSFKVVGGKAFNDGYEKAGSIKW